MSEQCTVTKEWGPLDKFNRARRQALDEILLESITSLHFGYLGISETSCILEIVAIKDI
jgi:hypothetical protein